MNTGTSLSPIAPEFLTSEWLNADAPITFKNLRGKVIVVEAFQMLCPGCVSHGLPQMKKVREIFPAEEVAVLGIHSVFEHHEAQGSVAALKAFLHEYKITFPIAIDAPSQNGAVPQTMAKYQFRGTPTVLLIDRQGRLRKQRFGLTEDLILGAEIMSLLNEANLSEIPPKIPDSGQEGCDSDGCSL